MHEVQCESSVLTHWEPQRQGEAVVARERLGEPWHQTPQVCLQTGCQSQRLWLSSPKQHWTTWWQEIGKGKEEEKEMGEASWGESRELRKDKREKGQRWKQKNKIKVNATESMEQSHVSFLYLCATVCLHTCFICFLYVCVYLPLVFHTSSQFTLWSTKCVHVHECAYICVLFFYQYVHVLKHHLAHGRIENNRWSKQMIDS